MRQCPWRDKTYQLTDKKKKIEEIYFPWLFICDYRKNLQFDFVILINFYLVPSNVHLWS